MPATLCLHAAFTINEYWRSNIDIVVLKNLFPLDVQKEIYQRVQQIQPGFYTPTTKWGKKMNLQMNCLGWHWNAKTYKYEKNRNDADQLPCAPIPSWLQAVAKTAMEKSKYWDGYIPFDICICNLYTEAEGKLGLHQDNSETKASLATGYPVLSVSIGSSCIFEIGGTDRKDPKEKHTLESGDVVLFGRSKRLAFHGVTKLLRDTTPAELDIPPGRLNLTFRIL